MSLDDLLLDTSFLFIADELDLSIDTTEVDFFGIKIDSKPVIKMYSEENDATTFTFAIKYEEGEPLKNVLLHCRNGGAVGHILSYHGSSDELLDVFCQTNDDDVFIPVSKEPLNGNMLELRGCIFIVVETCIKCTGGPFHTCEQSCQCPTPNDPCRPPVLTTQTLRVCDGDGGGSGDDNVHFFPHADGSGPNGGGSTGVAANDPDPNEFGTEIIVPTDLDRLRSIYVVLRNIGLLDEIDAESILTSLPEDCFGEDMLPSSDCVLESVVESMFPECDLSTAALEAVLIAEETNATGTSWKDLQDLSCDNLECVFGDADLLLAVMNESSKEMINPCSPEKSSGDIINDALAEAQNEDCSLEGFEAALDGVDKIIPDQSFENCDKVKCIYDLLDNQNNGLFCSTFGELFDSEEFTLELFTAPRSSLSWNADGATSFSGNSITITIADDLCDGDAHPLDIASTILHEAIHAAMYQSALNGDPNLNSTDYCLIWQDHFQTNDPCHEVMANQYVEHLAQAIADLDGNRFSLDFYMYSAWAGLSSVGEQVGLLSDPYVSQYYDEYQVLIDSPFDDCR